MGDPLSEMVELLQPSAPRSKVVSGAGHWRVDREEKGQPFYCVILDGGSLLTVEGHPPVTLREGDFVLVPAPFGFTMSSLEEAAKAGGDPLTVTMLPGETRHGNPDAPTNARLLVGHFEFASPDAALLVRLLPQLLHIREDKRLAALVRLVTDEACAERPARDMILARLLEVLLVEALRSTAGETAPAGILRGLGDPRLATAIRLLHEQPTKDWTVKQMAQEAALSRSVFFNRFRRIVGVTPMEYLISWRMALAKKLLRHRDVGLQEIAERIGYGSASAFSTAFTRLVGVPPSRYAEQAISR
ncbi:AraC-like DNA-binding protein [Rhizobium mesoamericanum]|uniref:AraC family transcriptional regulator n=1 Tax=Rhizobium mesoamericanum TaxID=1079800 RepID=UPI0027818C73|nr:AraC family transcriptional regulator [Rhizobium mesoamericanum]MDQ0558330.1 AraC-like DNA-binding protein [Rhizobium mesoamericanum]